MIAGHDGILPSTAIGIIHSKRSCRGAQAALDQWRKYRDTWQFALSTILIAIWTTWSLPRFLGIATRLIAGRRVPRCQGIADTIVQWRRVHHAGIGGDNDMSRASHEKGAQR